MKKILALAFCLLLPSAALADVMQLDPANTLTVLCTSGGTNKVTTPADEDKYWEVHVSNEVANVCYAGTCVTLGMERVPGNHGPTLIKRGSDVSCRSVGNSAVLNLVPGRYIR